MQSLVLGNTSTVENVYQVLEDRRGARRSGKRRQFTFEFSGERKDVELIIEADIEGVRDDNFYRFSNGYLTSTEGVDCITFRLISSA